MLHRTLTAILMTEKSKLLFKLKTIFQKTKIKNSLNKKQVETLKK